ncbi:MAG: aldehyde dehydrogenase family protein [Silvanigrellales bacterium]|nr:aldehyde dehydrogenase family protein [Silvanigrellales bacterium]
MPRLTRVLSPYINGRFALLAKPERTFEALDPAKPGDVLATMVWSKDLVGEITAGMRTARLEHQKLDLEARLALVTRFVSALRDRSEELKREMMRELSRSRAAVDEEWALCEELFGILPPFCRDALGEKTEQSGWSWSYAPVGLCLLSANVSLPIYSLLSATLPALVAGNAVCVRPSLHCPLSAVVLAECAHAVSLPAGLFQVVFGDLETSRRLLLSQQFDCVLCSGGEETLEQIRRDLSANQNIRMVLCGGGKNAALVLPSANIELASRHILYGATVDCGQRLESTGLAFVHESILDTLTDSLVAQAKIMPIGVKSDLGDASRHTMGPLCSANSWERYLRFQGIAARESAETLRWGKPIDNTGDGFFVSPGIHLMPASKVSASVYASNAFFGPDVCIVPVVEAGEAVEILNAMQASRVLGVHTAFEEELLRVRRDSHVPTVTWNTPTTELNTHLPTVGRGRAGNSYVTGIRFLFNTVYPRTLNKVLLALLVAIFASLFGSAVFGVSVARADYKKAVEGNEVVKGKFYPKGGRFQLNIGGGTILNQSFIDTYLITGSATYHFNEWHALNVEGFFGISSDRNERTCVESFYRDTKRAAQYGQGSEECGEVANPAKGNASTPANSNADNAAYPNADEAKRQEFKDYAPLARKPAYMPIRQINTLAMVNYQWTPVYGKALWFLSWVGYLDLYANAGLGLAMSEYSPYVTTFPDGRDAKDGTTNDNEYGVEGRPTPLSETSPTVGLGVGSRFFFAKHMMLNIDLRNFTVVAKTGDSSFMNFFALWGGVGVIF